MNLAAAIEPHPSGAVALISRGRPTTYGKLREQVASMRGGYSALGLEPGDRVGILCGNNWYFVSNYLAILGAGMVAVPLNPSSPARAVERELAAVGARAVMVGPAGQSALAGVDPGAVPALQHVVVTEGSPFQGTVVLDDLLVSPPVPIVDRDAEDLATLMFTSGTAGSPKAAMLSHGNLLANQEQMQALEDRAQTPEDVSLGVLPLFHIFGLNVVLGLSLRAGSSVLLIERFDPISALEAIERHGVTVVSGAPTMWAAWAAMPEAPPDALRTVRVAASGAAKLSSEVGAVIERRFGVTISEGYGLTEASPVVATSAGTEVRAGSIGSPLPGLEVRLVDLEGDDVLVGDAGEVWVRGPNVFAGYWQDEAATRGALTEDGWLRTGDVATVDDDGYLFLVDRMKDLIIVSGFNVYPAEVEEVIAEMPGVRQVAVVGVPHPYSGEAVKAFVVVEPGHSYEEDHIIEWCSRHLARYKCPDKVMFVDELPVNPGGKILRRALR